MAFKLVKFVEDLIWHICPESEVKKSKENNNSIVTAKYGSSFYPALLINEGKKKELLALKKRYIEHDKILKKYYKFIPFDEKDKASRNIDAKDVKVQTTQININKAIQTDTELSLVSIKSNIVFSYDTSNFKNASTQTDVDCNIVPSRTNCPSCHETSFISLTETVIRNVCAENGTQTDSVLNSKSSNSMGCLNNGTSANKSVVTYDETAFEMSNTSIDTNETPTISIKNSESKPEPKLGVKKLNFCMFRKIKVNNFARHLQTKHKNEEKVREFLKLPVGDAQRLAIIKDLRSLGAYMYNTDTSNKSEDIIVARRSSLNFSMKDYVPCPQCKNYFKKSLLYRHYRRCGNVSSAPRNLQALSRATVADGTTKMYKKLETKILPGMVDDTVSSVAKNDNLILLYGNYLCERHESDDHLFYMIRQKLRQLANFLISMRAIEPLVTNLESAIRPNLYNTFLEAVRKCAGYNEENGTYRAPSLVCALGQAVKECAEKLVIECIKRKDNSLSSDVEAWLTIYKKEFSVLSRRANTIIIRQKWNKPRLLPLTSDILKLNDYLKNIWNKAFIFLEKGFDISSWNDLSRSTLLLILIFNRKRVGEMEKLLISDYNRKHNIQKDSETYRNLKPSEQIFSQRYVRVEIRGKLGRAVSLMISTEEVAAIDIILKYRNLANVHHENPYVFGRGVNKFFEGARCLRDAANNCHADQPALLRGTKLRKHIATVSQALNLTENELSILADYMGHNIDVHRHFYRLPNEAIHLAKVSQLLYALDKNRIHKYKGKSLDEINFDVDLDVESESDNDEHVSNSSDISQTTIHTQDDIVEASSSKAAQANDLEYDIEQINNSQTSKYIQQNIEEHHPFGEVDETQEWTPDRKRRKVTRNCPQRRTWRTPEKYAIKKFFKSHLSENKLPSYEECERAIAKHSALRHRTKQQIKLWISNKIKRKSSVRKLFD